jgi:hypothetical protein
VKRVSIVLLLAVVAGITASARSATPQAARADACSLPAQKPVWIDFGDGSVPYWQDFAKPGLVAAASNFIFPPQIRARGAKTVYFDLNFTRRTGTPTEPADPATVVDRANRLYTFAANAMACGDPVMAENELQGASTLTPWSPGNAQYRANVLLFLRTLASHGAKPVLLVSSQPYTGGEAGDWWRQVAAVASIVREAYFPAPKIYKLGVIQGNRAVREMFRAGAQDFLSIGIPPSKLGIMLGFHTTPGSGGREGLKPASAWFQVTKWQVLAAKEVSAELGLASVWSWGWATWTPGETDPDKPANACVYLWTRNPKLCDAPKLIGSGLDTDLTSGQLSFPRGVRCTVYGAPLRGAVAASLTRVTQDPQAAFTAAYARAVASRYAHVTGKQVLEAEKAVVALSFHGSRSAYLAALQREHASVSVARGIIADELRRVLIQSRLRVSGPSSADIQSYYDTYATAQARLVQVKPAAPWLGGTTRGFALGSVAPPRIFTLQQGRQATVRTMTGTFKVKALGPTVELAELPLAKARRPIATALLSLARDTAYQNWLLARQKSAQNATLCWRDQLPAIEVVPLTDYLPFLAVDSGAAASSTPISGGRG